MVTPGHKILVVEDEPDIRKLVQYNLAQERFRVFEAENGEQALKMVQRDRPNLVILDLMLPGLSGLELCRILRDRTETAQLPILMLTAKAGEADKVVGLEMGADDYEVFVRGKAVKLTLKEFELLRFLVHNPSRVLSRDQLLDRVWGGETFVTPRTVDVHIRRLRKAIEKDDRKPKWILTLRGVGYKFDEKALEQ